MTPTNEPGSEGQQQETGWTCPVCGLYCKKEWLICPACDFVRPADYPMDDEHTD